ncbi:ABC transporter ATP-binding protein [Halalkalibacter hemicellulosilyticus]|uniref:ATP-binding transport protein n=1 Tax=Halalkalibacter hemicellulosilyticusJCM 9152 TaxID=1236971 RepID=W4QBS7_9BACI|nr:ATP-binding transport protein [Halalkalibacter hemicellulosilyticusJCM 9152]
MKHTDTHFYNRLGVAFETPNFYQKFTAAENLQFFQSFYRKNRLDGQELMAKMGLSDAYHTRVSEFSKGMKMRLNLCRAFLHDPELIFLDEPTSGLDPVNVKKVKNFILEKKAQGKTIILNTHNMSVAEELCDRVAFIVNGSIKLIESPTVLKKQYSEKIVTVIYENEGVEIRKQFELKKLGQHTVFQNILKQDQIVKIETEEKTLEDIFIAFTGRNLQ